MRARAHFLARGPLLHRSAVLWGAGPIGKGLLSELDRAGASVEAFVDIDPRKIGQRVHGRRVLAPDALPHFKSCVVLGAVGAPGARGEIRTAVTAAGFTEGTDFFACA